MAELMNAITFGATVAAFVLGISSIIMGFIAVPQTENGLKEKVEYGFFGISGIVIGLLLTYALSA